MGININYIDKTEIILIAIYSPYSVVQCLPLPKFRPITLACNLTRVTENKHFSKRVTQLVVCQRHTTSTSYHDWKNWVLYRIKLIHLSTIRITIENQTCSQWLAWPSIFSTVQFLHPVCKRVHLLCCLFFCAEIYSNTDKTNNKY